jgi:glycosyltransferase involved in cell wall biosynthesis
MINMRIAILHDYFDKMGGGERLIVNLAKAINADIYTGFCDYQKTHKELQKLNVTEIGTLLKRGGLRTIYLMEKFKKLKLDYDFFIFSGTVCISAAKNNHPNILYLHTPPRHMYDLKQWFYNNSNFFQRIGLKLLHYYLYPRDQFYMGQFDRLCPNSENVKKRVLKYYGKKLYDKCEVVYTGVESKKFYYKKSEDFYLSTSRLDPLKRVDLIINAFRHMPDKKLFITSTGPEESRLKQLARNCNNIEFLGSVSHEKILDLYARCRATVTAAVDEDLGLTPIEGQISGKPAIVVREGGLMESVIENKTGISFEPNEVSLIEAIKKAEKMKWNHGFIQKRAKRFDIAVFVDHIKKIVKEVDKQFKFS